ncbi:hypothetical protein Cyast_2397 [Cyanobacterium stanieri PCC 7202]|uniref:Glutathione S-transferase n=1 Tax=Cyanobacterium stanieri (strain ATCC 29140 / PCC 7202) TaxID=292563 RepID=K9YQF0_CYASC|nr:hypothetical protein Cyast_2397 [Cyanobacterium stanieri PCC 7202]
MRLFPVLGLVIMFFVGLISEGMALPPAHEIPEEILRTEIIVEGRSPLDNEPLSAQEYAQLQQSLRESPYAPVLNEDVRHTIFLLQLLKMFRTFNPL